MATAGCGLRRLLIDFDSTLNPGQGNAPITAERSAMLSRYLRKWQEAQLEVYILTSSNPDVKIASLEAAGLRGLFSNVLSSTLPKKFPSKGAFLEQRIRKESWRPEEQLLADDSIEAVQSIFHDAEGAQYVCGPLAHTLRLPQHSPVGLVEEDLALINSMVAPAVDSVSLQHHFCFQHAGQHVVDVADSPEKCMLDSLPEETRGQVLHANPEEIRAKWLNGRPDLAELHAKAAATAATSQPTADQKPQAKVAKTQSKSAFAPPASSKSTGIFKTPAQAVKGKGKGAFAPPPRSGAMAPGVRTVIDLAGLENLVGRLEASAQRLGAPPAATAKPVSVHVAPSANESEHVGLNLVGLELLATRLETIAANLGH